MSLKQSFDDFNLAELRKIARFYKAHVNIKVTSKRSELVKALESKLKIEDGKFFIKNDNDPLNVDMDMEKKEPKEKKPRAPRAKKTEQVATPPNKTKEIKALMESIVFDLEQGNNAGVKRQMENLKKLTGSDYKTAVLEMKKMLNPHQYKNDPYVADF